MEYKIIKPCTALAPYIHSFWELKGEDNDKQWERNFPDGCAGLVVNIGDTCATDNGSVRMDFGKTYVVGAMTSFKDSFIDADAHLLGVCLKPGVFRNFYNYVTQNEITDQTIQLEKRYSFDLDKVIKNPVDYLNTFFVNRLQKRNEHLQTIIEAIDHAKGQLSIDEIARMNFTTVRQLERTFKAETGISPKAYSCIIRFQHALSRIKNSDPNESLFDIALECGYYDHAHLTNEIKRNTGLVPSQL
ncbi:helix-turn-helix domain-containing protein [Chitinophaga nivalis]|uniref:AraC family transcriptional regulator n=1 Tax=Chitinophaga nivalis TaxID=2991709 RepID=A0ABT3IPM1_9BACT|nr:AraC family transcriptional regulator [Chitinophaga nivalis]MCW3464468.1 AraC family transcriptional regulator [Chitinophaga nivalis]MCW3485841.1 AraC family transcriptional regulator [Chitinophaga nivalis]